MLPAPKRSKPVAKPEKPGTKNDKLRAAVAEIKAYAEKNGIESLHHPHMKVEILTRIFKSAGKTTLYKARRIVLGKVPPPF